MYVSKNEGPDATELYAVDDNHKYSLPRLPERAPAGTALLALAERELHRYPRFGEAERRFTQGNDPRLRQVLGQLSPNELEATLESHYGQRGLGARLEQATDRILRAMMADVALPKLARLAARTTDADTLTRIGARLAAFSRHDVTPGALPELADEARAKAGLGWPGPARGASTSAELIADAPVSLQYVQQARLEAERGFARMAVGFALGGGKDAMKEGFGFILDNAVVPCAIGVDAMPGWELAKRLREGVEGGKKAAELRSLVEPAGGWIAKEAASVAIDALVRRDQEAARREDPATIDHAAGLRPMRALSLGRLDVEWSGICKSLREDHR